VEFKRNALALRCKRAGCLACCHISQKVRTKMGLRGCAAILLSEAIFSGYAGYWFLSIGTAVLFVCDSFTMIGTEMPFRDPCVWESFGLTFGDRDASFGVQVVAQHRLRLRHRPDGAAGPVIQAAEERQREIWLHG
jgi:hypothetical protein